jgi:transcriptional regulator with XRE-family HTH domain
MLTGEQLRAARALVRMEQSELSRLSGVSVATIKRLEGIEGPISANTSTIKAIEDALGEAGVIWIPANGEGPGVRRRKFDRGELHELFGLIIEALDRNEPLPPGAMSVVDQLGQEGRVGGDLLPGRIARSILDLDPEEERMPGTYREGALQVGRIIRWRRRADRSSA